MIPFTNKVNELLVGQVITSEPHQIGILATATYSSGQIRLVQVPQGPAPAVVIPGYTEITSGSPTGVQFLVDYTTGVVTFSSSQNGNSVAASYTGLGSEIAAEDVNEIQNPLSTIATQTLIYVFPFTSASASWALASHIVVPLSISNVGTDDFTFPRDVIVTRNLVTPDLISSTANVSSTGVIRLANNVDTISWRNAANSGDLALTVNGTDQLTFNGVPIEINSLTSAHLFVGNGSNVATDTAVTGDISISNTGVTAVNNVQAGVITNTMVNASAAIVYSKLNLTGSIVDADISISAAIAYSKLNLTGDIIDSDISVSAAIAYSKLASLGGSTNDVLIQSAGGFVTPSSILSTNLFLTDGSVSATGSFDLNSHQINNLVDPTVAQDAATKNYVDTTFPVKVANVALTGQNTDLGPTTLFTPATTGVYRVSVYLVDTTTGTATITANIGWTDDAQLESASTSPLPLTILGYTDSTFFIESTSGNPITYSITNTGGYTTDFYSIYVTVEQLS